MYRVMWLFLTPMFICLALGLVGVDQFTTLSDGTPSAWVIVGGWTAGVFYLSLRAYLVNDETPEKITSLKRKSKRGWISVGIVFALSMAGLSGLVTNQIVKTAAQYLPGGHRYVSGEVMAVRMQKGRGACRLHATVSVSSSGEEMRTCAQASLRAAIGPLDLAPGQHVTLQLKDTFLGTVVLEIKHDRLE